MGVKFLPFGIGAPAGQAEASSFSDDFIRANNGDLGQNWLYKTVRLNINDAYIVGSINTNNLLFTHDGGDNLAVNPMILLPRSLVNSSLVYGLSQFVQVTFVAQAGGNNSGGPCVFNRWDAGPASFCQQNYHIRVNQANSAILGFHLATGGADLVTLAAGTIVAGDVLRLEVVPGAAGVNTLRSFINGVLLDTRTDSNITQIGVPGMQGDDLQIPATQRWSAFSCGAI